MSSYNFANRYEQKAIIKLYIIMQYLYKKIQKDTLIYF